MYTVEGAEKEVKRRWENVPLRRKVEEFLGNDIPEVLREAPRSVLGRQIATPNFESQLFNEMAKKRGLKPLWWTYHGDKFCTANPDKVSLGKMGFVKGKDKNQNPMVVNRTVINFQRCDNKPFDEIHTEWGEPFVDFHHRLFTASMQGCEIWDATSWFKKRGGRASQYYVHYLSLFIANGILFENFLEGGKEEKFTNTIVKPAIEEIKERFGAKPLIVPLLPFGD